MEALFKKVIHTNNSNIPFLRKNSLPRGVLYVVRSLERMETEYGEALVAVIADSGGEVLGKVFLPAKYTKALDTEDVEYYNVNAQGDVAERLRLTINDVGLLSLLSPGEVATQ